MRKILALATAMLFCCAVFSQKNASIRGQVVDTTDHRSLQNTLITLMKPGDSTLISFARADKSGNFQISQLDSGTFILMATHPYLGDLFDNIRLGAGEQKELGILHMLSKSKLLEEVIVRSGSPIRIKGDTTIYTADSFKVREGANVEELLRTLPGIQVDKDGKIVAMGERVTKVLVDGEEFFGTDPGIATKNLRADVVQEVQVFDKKSDQAEFTGIDDGVKDKTINLKLKEDKKKGYFGKIEAGGGLPDKFNNSAMLNAFKAKRKLAAYGIMSNTGQTNLNWEDANNYGGGDGVQTEMTEDGGMMIMYSGSGDDYWGGRNGIPTNWNGGLHYSNKFDNSRQSLNAGYKFSKVNAPGVTRTFSKTFFPDTSWFDNSRSENYSSVIKHGLNLTVESMLDSSNSLKWTTRANKNNTSSSSDYYSERLNDAEQFINTNRRTTTNEADNSSVNSSLLWRHKFKKLSRTLSVNTDFSWSESKNDGLLLSRLDYYNQGNIERYDSIDQQNIRNSRSKSFGTRIAYTEPLMKDAYLELSYAFNYYNNSNERITNIKDGNGKYGEMIDSLSNSFEFNRLVNTPGINFRMNKRKYNYSFGSSVGFSHFVQRNLTDGQKYNYNFTNFFPRANFMYKFKPSESLRFNYNGSTTAPTLEQLQPIRVNTDPLNIYIGNQDLKQAFRHTFSLSYNTYNVLKESGIWTNLSYNTTQNAFTQFSSIDSGVRTYQTVNVNGVYNVNLYTDFSFTVGKDDKKWRLGTGPSINKNRNIDFVRDEKTGEVVKNMTNTNSLGLRLNVSKYVKDKFSVYISPGLSWNESKASVNSAANAKYWQANGWLEGSITLPAKIELRSDMNYQFRQKDTRFPADNSFTIWNASLTRRFFKDNALEMRVSINDILNQNRGYNRNFNSYNFTETYYNTLQRFWMVTAIWNISKNGKPAGF